MCVSHIYLVRRAGVGFAAFPPRLLGHSWAVSWRFVHEGCRNACDSADSGKIPLKRPLLTQLCWADSIAPRKGPTSALPLKWMTLKQNQLNWRRTWALSFMCQGENSCCIRSWLAELGPSYQATIQRCMGPSWQTAANEARAAGRGSVLQKGISNLLSHASHVPGSCYTQVHDCTSIPPHTHTHRCSECVCISHGYAYTLIYFLPVCEVSSHRSQSDLLEYNHVLDSPHLLHHHHPPHQPMTNIYTAKEGTACVITIRVQKVSSEGSFSVH